MGQSFTNEVIRDDCIEGQGYCVCPCSSTSLEGGDDSVRKTEGQALDQAICLQLKNIDDHCETDRECRTVSLPADSTDISSIVGMTKNV